jgi:RNA polymerase-binding transcription factor DksA
MTNQTIARIRRGLLGRRGDLMSRQRIARRDEQELVAERELTWQDAAAHDTAATVLQSLGEAERAAVAKIDAALDRIARGTYGACAACGEPIDEDRLDALPETARCMACASLAA